MHLLDRGTGVPCSLPLSLLSSSLDDLVVGSWSADQGYFCWSWSLTHICSFDIQQKSLQKPVVQPTYHTGSDSICLQSKAWENRRAMTVSLPTPTIPISIPSNVHFRRFRPPHRHSPRPLEHTNNQRPARRHNQDIKSQRRQR
jgi:hypothetical protein